LQARRPPPQQGRGLSLRGRARVLALRQQRGGDARAAFAAVRALAPGDLEAAFQVRRAVRARHMHGG